MVSETEQRATPVSFRPGELELAEDGTGHLVGGRCENCNAHYFPARQTCARCLSRDVSRVPLSETGTLYTFTVVRQSIPMFEVPYVLGYVDLPEGVRLMGQISGIDPEDVRIGMTVTLSIEPFGEDEDGNELTGYRFRPVDQEAADD